MLISDGVLKGRVWARWAIRDGGKSSRNDKNELVERIIEFKIFFIGRNNTLQFEKS